MASTDRLPPYVSFITWQKILIALDIQRSPRINKQFFKELGISQSQMLAAQAALRYFKLVDIDGSVSQDFKKQFGFDEVSHKTALKNVFKKFYEPLFQIESSKGLNIKKLHIYFRKLGAKGDIIRKCTAFFIRAGLDLDLLNASDFKNITNIGTLPNYLDKTEKLQLVKIMLSKFPVFNPEWSKETQTRWFENYDRLMKLIEK
jgi:hypothetical protein